MNQYQKNTLILIGGLTIVRLILAGITGLGTGEAYYWRGAEVLEWSYFDQPPLFFWLSAGTLKLFGLNNFALRLPAVLMFIGTQFLVFKVAERMYSARAGFYAVLLMNISFVFTLPIAAWFQPDAPLMLFWMLTVYYLVELFFPKNETYDRGSWKAYRLWILIGLSLGLTALSKYHAVFILGSAFLFVLFNPQRRHWIWHPGPYIALLLMFLMLTPVFIWNMQNDWISFTFQGSRAGGANWSIERLLRSIVGQSLWLAPWIWVPLIALLFRLRKSRVEKDSFLFWMSLLPILFFTVIAVFSKIGYHFHWQAPGYMMLFIPLGAQVGDRIEAGVEKTKKWLRTSVALTIILAVVVLGHTVTGFLNAFGLMTFWEEQFNFDKDPTIAGTDYDDIRKRFDEEGWTDSDSLFVGSPKWWQTGNLDWPLKGKLDILTFNHDARNHAYLFDPNDYLGYDAIFLRYYSKGPELRAEVPPFFDSIERLEPIVVTRSGRPEFTIEVFYCKNFQIPKEPMDGFHIYNRLVGKPPFVAGE